VSRVREFGGFVSAIISLTPWWRIVVVNPHRLLP
jgi:hypothetical protein